MNLKKKIITRDQTIRVFIPRIIESENCKKKIHSIKNVGYYITDIFLFYVNKAPLLLIWLLRGFRVMEIRLPTTKRLAVSKYTALTTTEVVFRHSKILQYEE
jgi:hypothetical protein